MTKGKCRECGKELPEGMIVCSDCFKPKGPFKTVTVGEGRIPEGRCIYPEIPVKCEECHERDNCDSFDPIVEEHPKPQPKLSVWQKLKARGRW